MNIKLLHIEKFRHLSQLDITIGNRLTAIAGQNGIGKSSILGLIGHVCREKNGHKTLDEKLFETEYSEIFKLSYPNYDKEKEHDYIVYFDDETEVKVNSLVRRVRGGPKNVLRFRTYKTENGVKDESKKDFPVLYLGLKRLIPLAQEDDVNQLDNNLSVDDIKFYSDAHNSILLLSDTVDPKQVKSPNKSFFAASTDKYDSLGNSAGQDNIGQILTAILSFKRLKEELGKEYKGGLLLIDEIDATLYAAAQEKLIEFLFQQSAKLDLQVVFTTHSKDILRLLLDTKYKHASNVVYLYKNKGSVKIAQENKLDEIIANLDVKSLDKKVVALKIDIYREDKEAQLFMQNIITTDIKKHIKFQDIAFSGEELLRLANKKIPAFTKSILLLDGDKRPSITKPHPKNVITLPGNSRPEDILFNFLKQLPEEHEFWGDIGGYSKQVCFRDCNKIGNREEMKKWFNSQIKYWGKSGNKLFKLWKKENPALVAAFNDKLSTLIPKLLEKK